MVGMITIDPNILRYFLCFTLKGSIVYQVEKLRKEAVLKVYLFSVIRDYAPLSDFLNSLCLFIALLHHLHISPIGIVNGLLVNMYNNMLYRLMQA